MCKQLSGSERFVAVRSGSARDASNQGFSCKTGTFSKRSVRSSAKQRERVSAGMRGEQVDEVGVQASMLQSAGDRGREQPGDALLALFGLAAGGELAVDDRAPECALGVVVGGLHAGGGGEGP